MHRSPKSSNALTRDPDVSAAEVCAAMDAAAARFDRSPIRDFIPLLIERLIRCELQNRRDRARAMSAAAHTVLDADLATTAPMGSTQHRGDDRGDDAEPGRRKAGLRCRPEPGRLPVDDLALDRQALEADPMGDPPAKPTPGLRVPTSPARAAAIAAWTARISAARRAFGRCAATQQRRPQDKPAPMTAHRNSPLSRSVPGEPRGV